MAAPTPQAQRPGPPGLWGPETMPPPGFGRKYTPFSHAYLMRLGPGDKETSSPADSLPASLLPSTLLSFLEAPTSYKKSLMVPTITSPSQAKGVASRGGNL